MKKLLTTVIAVLILGPAMAVQAESDSIDSDVIYDISVDRFNNGDGSLDQNTEVTDPKAFHGGDIQGIIDRLNLLKQEGFSAIVLSPLMANADDGYHGYWVKDFFAMEPAYGNMDDLQTLIDEAHDRDIDVLMEFVTSYTADSHELAKASDGNFVKDESIDAPWGDGAAVLDQSKEKVQTHLTEAAMHWMNETDLDGFQLHAADQSNPAFLNTLTETIKEQDDSFTVLADVLDPEADIRSLEENTAIDAVDDPEVQNMLTSVLSEPGQSMTPLIKATNPSGDRMLYADNMYTKRFTQLVSENGRNDLTSWKLALVYMYTAPGIPSVLQGSDIPMYGNGWPETQKLVPFNEQDDDLKEFYEKISAIHDEFSVLSNGDYDFVGENGAMSVFKRSNEEQTIFVALNNDVESQKVAVEGFSENKQMNGILGDNLVRQNEDGKFNLVLPRETAEIYVVEDNTGLNWPFILFIGGVFVLFIIGIIVTSRKSKQAQQ